MKNKEFNEEESEKKEVKAKIKLLRKRSFNKETKRRKEDASKRHRGDVGLCSSEG